MTAHFFNELTHAANILLSEVPKATPFSKSGGNGSTDLVFDYKDKDTNIIISLRILLEFGPEKRILATWGLSNIARVLHEERLEGNAREIVERIHIYLLSQRFSCPDYRFPDDTIP